MGQLLHYLLESGACLLVFYLLYVLVLRREKCFTYNRFYLLFTPLIAFFIPLLELPFLRQPEPLTSFIAEQVTPVTAPITPVPVQPKPFIVTPDAAYPVGEESKFDYTIVLLLLYGAGVAVFANRLVRQLYFLHRFNRETQAERFYWQQIAVHKTYGRQPTFSFGNCIYWDNSQPLSERDTESVFEHEAVHVRQKHSLDILYLEFFKIFFWFNPLLYFFQKSLAHTHEFIADAAVLRTTNPETYSQLLVNQVLHRLEFSFGKYFNKSLIATRLKMLEQNRRSNWWRQLLALPVVSTLLFFLSASSLPMPEAINNPAGLAGSFPAIAQEHFSKKKFSEPLFPGGKEAMYHFFVQNLKYPAESLEGVSSAHGLFVAVNVNADGTVDIPKYKYNPENAYAFPSSLPNAFDKEIQRVLLLMPKKWKPAMINGKTVASRYFFDFNFYCSNPAERLPNITEKEQYEWDISNTPVVTSRPIHVVLYDKNVPLQYTSTSPLITFNNPITTIQTASTSGSVQAVSSLAYDNKIQLPLFPGGRRLMYRYLRKNIRFDKYIHFLGNNTAGAFTMTEIKIDEKGQVAPVTSATDDAFAREINEAIRQMPAWQPAKVDGQPTAATYNLTLFFQKDVNGYEEGRLTENLEKYTGRELLINAVLFGNKAYVVENNPDEPVLTVVEKKPEFPGGLDRMYEFINQNLQYPQAARDAKLEGMVSVKFIVTKDGRILESRVEGHLSPETDAEILRVIQKMPRWVPGKQNGKAVNAEYTLPFKFRLNPDLPKS
ncbi:M56 family metallopeptidase [Adhaeribacter pallidiroseus]|uniref:TonB C-terminal domain-containing protein n=1 Tax=Adhaeribacter pallidiroseus TaxID=2072847 RepID=A0A369QP99_9BACT|nr:M56 family metallopeptidase [Adhaeribacter pallidiroseus]RDC65106.1 hypothetical protein AHMF7616_03730 [Adhaeribacter pallidiroseus]